ncbi:MAG: hypothetical protein K2J42_01330, partial [Muribaculaceae bacterium]|nr:hypothetical protein [Muribaculaceae bacterium]
CQTSDLEVMKDSLKLLLLGLFIGTVVVISVISLTRCMSATHEREPSAFDSVSVVVVHDTITDTVPVPVEVRPVGAVTAKLPKVSTDDMTFENRDTTARPDESPDSAAVLIPIDQKVYTDSMNYRAVISGYNVSLDTIAVFRQREYITQRLKPPEKRWGLSVGVGAVVGTDMRVRPGLFVGGTYTFVTF